MGSWAGDVGESPDSVYQKATSVLSGTGMKVQTTIPSQSLMAEGDKDVNWIVMVVLIIAGVVLLFVFGLGVILFIVALIYYFRAPKSVFTVGISSIPSGSRISITTTGSKAEAAQTQLIGILRQVGSVGPSVAARVCKACKANVTDPSATFCPSCGAKL